MRRLFQLLTCNKLLKPPLRFAPKLHRLAPPLKLQRARVQRVIRQNQLHPLLVRQPPLHQCEIQIRIAAVNLVAHDGMTDVREMNTNLMFATRARKQTEQRETRRMSNGVAAACGIGKTFNIQH